MSEVTNNRMSQVSRLLALIDSYAKLMRVLVSIGAVVASLTIGTYTASAHTGEFLHAFERWSGPPSWIPLLGLALAASSLIWTLNRSMLDWANHSLSARAFQLPVAGLSAWLILGFLQDLVPASRGLLIAGYLVLPFALLAVWVLIIARWAQVAREIGRDRVSVIAGIVMAIVFVIVMAWSSNLVAPPEAEDAPSYATRGFITVYRSYGPLAVWPNVEFWVPSIPLVGVISVGTGMLLTTFGSLSGAAAASATYSFRNRQAPNSSASVFGLLTTTVAGANFCCCCAPAFYPALSVLVGSVAAGSISVWFIGSASPFYDILPVMTIGALLWRVSKSIDGSGGTMHEPHDVCDSHSEMNSFHTYSGGGD